MKTFDIPMFVTSLFALCLFPGFDIQPVHADFNFGTPTILGPTINGPGSGEIMRFMSSDGLEMYLDWGSPEWGHWDICVSRRATINSDWGPPENLGPPINTQVGETGAFIPADGLSLYFASDRAGSMGKADIWVSNRLSQQDPWGEPVNLGPAINSTAWDGEPWLSPDGEELYFVSWRNGGYGNADIWVARRTTDGASWDQAVNLGPPVNSTYDEFDVSLSPDGLLLLFSDHQVREKRPGGYGDADLWVSRRSPLRGNWGTPVNLGPVANGPYRDVCPRLSEDGRTLYFGSWDRPENYGRWDIWQAPILPIVDFNGDGKVNGKDVVVLTQHWGESDSVCDIGPYAWGDGIVDEQDLFMLAEYLEEEVNDPTLVAHWGLDETEGAVACDCVGDCDAMVMGGAAWQPDGGVFGGALALDGVDDCIVTDSVAELSAGSFSILAWVKGGTPDEVILSGGTADWLYTNPADGSLMTALGSIAGNGVPLFSDVVITDGRWHRIGLVWDGTSRTLLVDEQEVARDEQAELAIPNAGLIIGAGAAADRFFSGQIDDIRIYRRAVKP